LSNSLCLPTYSQKHYSHHGMHVHYSILAEVAFSSFKQIL